MVSGIPNIINDLSNDLKARIEAVVQLTEQREELDTKLEIAKRDLKRVQIALGALSGNDVPIPVDAESTSIAYSPGDPLRPAQIEPEPRQVPVPATQVQSGPRCGACGGEMVYTSRQLNSGKTVNLWSCRDCRNERFG